MGPECCHDWSKQSCRDATFVNLWLLTLWFVAGHVSNSVFLNQTCLFQQAVTVCWEVIVTSG